MNAGMTTAEYNASERRKWSEKHFQVQVLAQAKALGWSLRYHTYDSIRSERGFPDLVLVHPERRRTLFAELKREGKHPTPAQEAWLSGLAQAGQETYIWRPSDWDALNAILEAK